jgi:hypothetical protein
VPALKSNGILLILVLFATLLMTSVETVHIVLADPQHCDQS